MERGCGRGAGPDVEEGWGYLHVGREKKKKRRRRQEQHTEEIWNISGTIGPTHL